MPVKLNWLKGRNLGLGFIYLGVMGLVQVAFIAIAQYAMKVGSLITINLLSVGIILALFYSVLVIFESTVSMSKFREARPFLQKKSGVDKDSFQIGNFAIDKMFVKPVLIVTVVYGVLFGLMIAFLWSSKEKGDLDASTVFVIASNVGAIFALIFASYFDVSIKRKTQ